jgi:hypothetical protein
MMFAGSRASKGALVGTILIILSILLQIYYSFRITNEAYYSAAGAEVDVSIDIPLIEQHAQSLMSVKASELTANASSSSMIAANDGPSCTTYTYETGSSRIQQCLQVLGTNGTWVQDWDFALSYGQYATPLVFPWGPFGRKMLSSLVPSKEAPVHWETSWRWVDYNNVTIDDTVKNKVGCQIDYTITKTYTKLCSILETLNIRRVLFLGDSLADHQYRGLLNMLPIANVTKFRKTNRHLLTCPRLGDVEFVLHMVKGGKEVANSPHVALQFAEEELRDLQMVDDDGRIVTLINIGAHYHNFTFYQQDIEFLMQFLDGLQQRKRHKKDLYFFRTTVSGHNKCHPRRPNDSNIRRNGQRVVPLKSYPDVDQRL